jgi:5'-3' exonuclease
MITNTKKIFLVKNNKNIFGIISDDSDMLVFGSPILMRKSINQHFTIITLSKLIKRMNQILEKELQIAVNFEYDNLIDFSILLGTDYGHFVTNKKFDDSMDLLKYYVINNKNVKNIISENQYEYFDVIKAYYKNNDQFDKEYSELLDKPEWKKPKLMELKQLLLKLSVDEDYIDKNNQILYHYYNKIIKKSNNYLKYNKFSINNKFDRNIKFNSLPNLNQNSIIYQIPKILSESIDDLTVYTSSI